MRRHGPKHETYSRVRTRAGAALGHSLTLHGEGMQHAALYGEGLQHTRMYGEGALQRWATTGLLKDTCRAWSLQGKAGGIFFFFFRFCDGRFCSVTRLHCIISHAPSKLQPSDWWRQALHGRMWPKVAGVVGRSNLELNCIQLGSICSRIKR